VSRRSTNSLWLLCLAASAGLHAGAAGVVGVVGLLGRWRRADPGASAFGPALAAGDGADAYVVQLLPPGAPAPEPPAAELLLRRRVASALSPPLVGLMTSPAAAPPEDSVPGGAPAPAPPPFAARLAGPPERAAPEEPTTGLPPRGDDPAPAGADGMPRRRVGVPGVLGARVSGSAVSPDYPERCERLGHEGVAEIECDVGVDGRVTAARVRRSAGCPDLDAAALEALRRTTFIPATAGGRPVPCTVVQPVRFRRER
jgi:protein TonB